MSLSTGLAVSFLLLLHEIVAKMIIENKQKWIRMSCIVELLSKGMFFAAQST
jgi:hypothetical protein